MEWPLVEVPLYEKLDVTFFKICKTWSFHVVVLQCTVTKLTKNFHARVFVLLIEPFVW